MVKETSKSKKADFESALNELNDLVEKLEKGGLSLEDSLQAFEQGQKLVLVCNETLKNAEQKIQILTEKNGKQELQSFAEEE